MIEKIGLLNDEIDAQITINNPISLQNHAYF